METDWNLVIGKEFRLLAKMSFESQKKGKKVNNLSKLFTVLDIDELLGNQIITIILML